MAKRVSKDKSPTYGRRGGGGRGEGGGQTIENSPCLFRGEPTCKLIQRAALAASAATWPNASKALTCRDRSLASNTRHQPTPRRGKRSGGKLLELFSSRVSVDQDLSVIVAETINDDDVKQRLVPIVFTRARDTAT